ncbi:MAG: hypothetical protein II834_00570 [Bacteroidaceae bacterium]|nr:hypothetical protein [Bacteroidaceae bacterium]
MEDINELRRRWKEVETAQYQSILNEEVSEDYTSSDDTESESVQTIQYDNGDKYVGSLDQNGLPTWFGNMYFADGDVDRFEGRWEAGNPIIGTLFFKDVDKYDGALEDWRFSGVGTFFYADGTELGECLWLNGEYRGRIKNILAKYKPHRGAQKLKNGIPHLTIGNIGHINDGKTTLAKAIPATLRNYGFKHQKVQSIDPNNISHVEYQTACRYYTHYDCPGYNNTVNDMLTGGTHMDGAILLVDADRFIFPQTRTHIVLARKANVPRLVVFVNKWDQIDFENEDFLIETYESEIKGLLTEYGYEEDTPIIFGSALGALNGVNEWEEKVMELMHACDTWF